MRHILIAASALLLVTSCKKEKDKLPSATATGANTFGCLVNGKAWTPTGRGGFSGVNPTSGGFFVGVSNTISIYIKAYAENDEITIYLKDTSAVGTYYLNRNTSIKPYAISPEASYGMYTLLYDPEYTTDSIHTGTVNITHSDFNAGIVSGTFEMQVYQKIPGKLSISVTADLITRIIDRTYEPTASSISALTELVKIAKSEKATAKFNYDSLSQNISLLLENFYEISTLSIRGDLSVNQFICDIF